MLPWYMYIVLFFYSIVCIFLIGVILIQSGKGGGISSLAQSSSGLSDALGTTGAERFLNKITSGAAISFMLLAIFISLAVTCQVRQSSSSRLFQGAEPTPAADVTLPDAEIPVPVNPVDGGVMPGQPAGPGSDLPGRMNEGGAVLNAVPIAPPAGAPAAPPAVPAEAPAAAAPAEPAAQPNQP